MKLLTEEIKRSLPPLYTYDSTDLRIAYDEIPVICTFFTPTGAQWHWYVTAGEQQEDGDWLLFGLVHGMEKEWGYFSLSELTSVDCGFGLGIERDLYTSPETIGDILEPV